MTTLDEIRDGLVAGTIELVSPTSPEYEEMQAWYEWFLLSVEIFLRLATAFGNVAAWARWGQMMRVAARLHYKARRGLCPDGSVAEVVPSVDLPSEDQVTRLKALGYLVTCVFRAYPDCRHCNHSEGLHYALAPQHCPQCDCRGLVL